MSYAPTDSWPRFPVAPAIVFPTCNRPRGPRVGRHGTAGRVPGRGGALGEEENLPAADDVRALWRAGRVEEARLALVRATHPSVYRYLKAMTRNPDVAEDLTQDTFVRAFQALGGYRGESRLTTWVLSIAHNLALNRARRLRLENRWFAPMEAPTDVADPRGPRSSPASPV